MIDNIRIAVLSAYDEVRAFLDNQAPEAMHYYNDELHEYLKGAASTYTFTTDAQHTESVSLVEGNKLAFKWRKKDYYFNIVRVIRNEYEVEVEAYSLNLELLNERVDAYKAAKAMKFAEYLNVFDFEKVLTLNINEVADKTITHEWTGSDTVLARIYSLATVFDAEAEFAPILNNDYSLKKIVMNVYKKNSSTDQGMGRYRQDIILRYGKEVSGITKTSDITELYTAIRPTGKDGLMITNLDKTEKDASGNIEYQSPKGDGCIRAVQARDRFPSNNVGTDRYSTVDWSYDTDNVNTLYGQALAELKKNCVPQVQYEVEGYFDTDIGDTVTIVDEVYNPPLYLQARVTEQSRSFTDPSQNKTIFDNFKELQSQIDSALMRAMQKLIAENKVYTCSILTDNGIVFKNNEGSTTLTASVMDAGKDMTGSLKIQWTVDGEKISTSKSITVNAADISGKAVYRYEATDKAGISRGYAEATVANVNDGEPGKAGEDGGPGADAYTLYLSTTSHVFNADYDGNLAKNISVSTVVVGYKGTKQITPVIGTLPEVSGFAFSLSGSTITITGKKGKDMPDNGVINIPVTLDGIDCTLTFTYAKVKDGYHGEDAKLCTVTGDQIMKYESGSATPVPSALILTAEYQNTNHGKWQYRNEYGIWCDFIPVQTNTTITIDEASVAWVGNTAAIRAIDSGQVAMDTITLAKLRDGSDGEKGDPGAEGTGIQSTTEEYYLSTSKESPSGGSWVTSPPTWSAGKYMWTRKKTVYKNPTSIVYTTPLCDSSWEAVNGIEVGVRNLLLNTNQGATGWGMNRKNGAYTLTAEEMLGVQGVRIDITEVSTEWSVIYYKHKNILFDMLQPATEYTLSMDVYSSVETQGTYGAIMRPSSLLPYTSTFRIPSLSAETWHKVSVTLTTVETFPELIDQVLYWGPFNTIGTIKICNLKIEYGNKATPWTPAPEDIQTQIDSTVNALNDLVSDSRLTPNEKVIANKEWLIIADEYPKYIVQADAYEVSTTAYTNAYNALNSYLNTTNSGVIFNMTTTTDINSTTFTNNFKTYYNCKVELMNAVNTAKAKYEADQITVGGRNLIAESATWNDHLDWGISHFDGNEVTMTGSVGATSGVSFTMPITDYGFKRLRNAELTFSMDYIIDSAITYGTTSPWVGVQLSVGRNTDTGGSSQNFAWYGNKKFPTEVTTEWKRYSVTWKTSDYDVVSSAMTFFMRDADGIIRFRYPKLELSNKASDWSYAPEDIQEQLDNCVTDTNMEYYLSTSTTSLENGEWVTIPPLWVDGKHMWIRITKIYGDGTIEIADPACIAGAQGIPGIPGIDGKTPYLHIAYANSADGNTGFSVSDSTNKLYIGQYTDYTSADSTDPTKYSWTKIKGDTGAQGPQGIQGPKGVDGETYYTWLKYADTPTTGMSDDPSGKSYIGLAYNKTTATESNDYSDYTWSLIKGDQGVAGEKGADGETYYTWLKYATSADGANMSDDPTGKTYIGLAYNKTTATESTTASDYTWSLIKGDKGDTGDPGTGYTVLLSNESYSFAGGVSAAVAGSTYTNINAWKNTTQVAATIAKIGSTPVSGNATGIATGFTGLTAAVTGNGTTTCKITFTATTALTTKNGSVDITTTVDGKSFVKTFSFSLALKGATGDKGDQGEPTGVVVSATEPSTKFDGMLWKHTGTVSGLTKDVTYRWTGTKWETYLFAATNIETESLSALSANLGTVTAGNIKNSKNTVEFNVAEGWLESATAEVSTMFANGKVGFPTGNFSNGGLLARLYPDKNSNNIINEIEVNGAGIFINGIDIEEKLKYKTYTPTNVNANIGNKSIIVKANAYDCKINGFLYLNPATYDNDTILFKTPLKPTGTIYFSTTVAGRGFKVMTDGSVRANGTYTVSTAIYVYFGVSFAIA